MFLEVSSAVLDDLDVDENVATSNILGKDIYEIDGDNVRHIVDLVSVTPTVGTFTLRTDWSLSDLLEPPLRMLKRPLDDDEVSVMTAEMPVRDRKTPMNTIRWYDNGALIMFRFIRGNTFWRNKALMENDRFLNWIRAFSIDNTHFIHCFTRSNGMMNSWLYDYAPFIQTMKRKFILLKEITRIGKAAASFVF